jgi:hypothetical protein
MIAAVYVRVNDPSLPIQMPLQIIAKDLSQHGFS